MTLLKKPMETGDFPPSQEIEGRRLRDWLDLHAGGMGLIDTHVHTDYSDGQATLRQVEQTCRDMGIACCVTDHNEVRASLKLFERGRVATACSLEVGSREHIELIVIFRRPEDCEDFFIRHVEPYRRPRWYAFLSRPLDYVMEAAREYDAIISIPHPFAPLWKNIKYGRQRRDAVFGAVAEADCIEVYNGSMPKRANRQAGRLCWRLEKIPLGGSDSHHKETIGAVLSTFDEPIDSGNIYDMIRLDRVVGFIGLQNRPRYMMNTWTVVKRHTRKLVNL